MSNHPNPPRHFRPQSSHQRREVLRRIDAAERETLQSQPGPLTADPYLLRTPAPLRFIKPPAPANDCNSGACPITPGCTSRCHLRQAHQALRTSIDARHTQQAELPPAVIDHALRRRIVIGFLVYAVACFGLGAWFVFS